MRLHGHVGSLLRQIPDLNILTEASWQVTARLVVHRVKSPQYRHDPDLSRLDAKSLTRDSYLGFDAAARAAAGWWNRSATMTQDDEREFRAQLARLLQEHRDLDLAIAALEGAPGSDLLQIQRLKKRKLHLKDKITFVEDQLTPDIIA
jgi:hypothetical protein